MVLVRFDEIKGKKKQREGTTVTESETARSNKTSNAETFMLL